MCLTLRIILWEEQNTDTMAENPGTILEILPMCSTTPYDRLRHFATLYDAL